MEQRNQSIQGTIAEKRSHRIELRIPVTVHIHNGSDVRVYDAELVNVSEGGAFVKGIFPIELGTRVTLRLGDLQVDSQVRWVRGSAQSGFGIQFEGLACVKEAFISQLVKKAIFGSISYGMAA
jgi:hypothetical protein